MPSSAYSPLPAAACRRRASPATKEPLCRSVLDRSLLRAARFATLSRRPRPSRLWVPTTSWTPSLPLIAVWPSPRHRHRLSAATCSPADLAAQKWGAQIDDFLATAQLVFQDNDAAYQRSHGAGFAAASATVRAWQQYLNNLVANYVPGYTPLHAAALQRSYQGRGQLVAIFDVFDQDLLAKQRSHYPSARIDAVVRFGDPVGLSHGNAVIDVLLALAPDLTIVPVSADAASSNAALRYLNGRRDIPIVNMSRALLGSAGDTALDPLFATLLEQLSAEKLVCKALGNTGTDLHGQLSPRRAAAGLGPVGDLTAYDTGLIRLFIGHAPATTHMLLAANLDLYAEQVALAATIPGDDVTAAALTLGAPADGVYSWSTGDYEAGSSFAAPQLAALAALLSEACTAVSAPAAAPTCLDRVVSALKIGARPNGLAPSDSGLGVADGDRALGVLTTP